MYINIEVAIKVQLRSVAAVVPSSIFSYCTYRSVGLIKASKTNVSLSSTKNTTVFGLISKNRTT